MVFPIKMYISQYFDEEVLACPCCGWMPEDGIEEDLLRFLDNLQEQIEEPLEIVSCIRCTEYNGLMGGHENSYHIQGIAVDMGVPTDMTIEEFADLCEELGAEGLILKHDERIVHVDLRGYKEREDI
jgi:uncharacterized protein YcbK (DUF882 family)